MFFCGIAQPPLAADPGMATRYAVWQHGAAADLLAADRSNWTIENLVENLGNRRK